MEKELRRELQPLYAQDPTRIPSVRELEKLPYLGGCIREGLRWVLPVSKLLSNRGPNRTDSRGSIGTGNLGRLGRVSPDTDLHFQQWVIPRGVSFFVLWKVYLPVLVQSLVQYKFLNALLYRQWLDRRHHDQLLDAHGPRSIPEPARLRSNQMDVWAGKVKGYVPLLCSFL